MEDGQPDASKPEAKSADIAPASDFAATLAQAIGATPDVVTPVEAKQETAGSTSDSGSTDAPTRPPREAREPRQGQGQGQGQRPPRPQGDRPAGDRRENRPPKGQGGGPREGGAREGTAAREGGRGGDRGGDRGGNRGPGDRGGDRGDRRDGGRPSGPGGRPFESMADMDIDKLMNDSLYLDNQAHAVVARMRDIDSGTKSQLRRLFNAVRRAVRTPENERQHQFVMLRARLAYTIARHSLRSLDGLERLLLQVTRKNEARGYERFKDLFEAIVAYNE